MDRENFHKCIGIHWSIYYNDVRPKFADREMKDC